MKENKDMENVNMNEKANINDELLEDISGGTPASLASQRCDFCGKITQNLNLVDHHLKKICKSCLKKINNK